MKKALAAGGLFLALAILFVIAPALVSAKSTGLVFVGFVLTAFAIVVMVVVFTNFFKGNL